MRPFPGHDGLHKHAGHARHNTVDDHDARNADDVISRPNNRAPSRRYLQPFFRVLAVAAGGVLWAFAASWTHYLNNVFAAYALQISLSLLFFEFSGYCVNAVQLHVYAADVLVRRGVDREGFR
jgi:hypothetical protein